jgi:hypothetical protein
MEALESILKNRDRPKTIVAKGIEIFWNVPSRVSVRGVQFLNCHFYGGFSRVYKDCKFCSCKWSRKSHGIFTKCELINCIFASENCDSPSFFHCTLTRTAFTSDLRSASFLSCEFVSGCRLEFISLTKVTFKGCKLGNTKFHNCHFVRVQGISYAETSFTGFGEANRLISAVRNGNGIPMFSCGCFYGNLNALRSYIDTSLFRLPGVRATRMFALEYLLKALEFSAPSKKAANKKK